jgi:peptidoglycan/LPS O-acetylase OafA/YrhL
VKRIELLDYGRLAAAGWVLFFHYFFNGIHNGKIGSIDYLPGVADLARYGYLGVEFFFMISGYVIFFSASSKTASQFLVSRATRLYPAFWCAVVLTSVAAFFWGGDRMAVSLAQVIANLTMTPRLFGYDYVDGVYWTLHFEWRFYLVVLLALMLGLQRRLPLLLLAWPLAIALAGAAGASWLPYMNGQYAYFAAGSVFAIHAARPNRQSALALLLCLLLCINFSATSVPSFANGGQTGLSPLVIGAIVLAQFLFFVLLGSRAGSGLRLRGSRLAGALSYPIYLIHAHIGYMAISHLADERNKLAVYAAVILAVVGTAYLMHRLVEQGMAPAWRRLFEFLLGRPAAALQSRILKFASSAAFRTAS